MNRLDTIHSCFSILSQQTDEEEIR